MISERLEEVPQHLVGNVLTQHKALQHRMVIVKASIYACVLDLFFKIFHAVESMHVRGIEDRAADGEVHVRGSEIAHQDSRDCARKTPVAGWIFPRPCPGAIASLSWLDGETGT